MHGGPRLEIPTYEKQRGGGGARRGTSPPGSTNLSGGFLDARLERMENSMEALLESLGQRLSARMDRMEEQLEIRLARP